MPGWYTGFKGPFVEEMVPYLAESKIIGSDDGRLWVSDLSTKLGHGCADCIQVSCSIREKPTLNDIRQRADDTEGIDSYPNKGLREGSKGELGHYSLERCVV
jgi:hypothetical protein